MGERRAGFVRMAFRRVGAAPAAAGGVTSLNGAAGAATLTSPTGTIAIGGVAPAPTLASAALTAGQTAWVESLQAMFVLEQTAAAAVALVVVAATGKAGYAWVR